MTGEIVFQQAHWLALLPVVLLAWAVLAWRFPHMLVDFAAPWRTLARRVYRHPLLAGQAAGEPERPRSSWYAWGMRWLAWPGFIALVLLALAAPVRNGQRLPDPPSHRDIMFVVDTSISLVLRDYVVDGKPVSREKVLKDVLAGFVRDLRGNRLGLIAFSEQAYTWVPLTEDHALLRYQLARLAPARLTGRTSRLGEALLYIAKRHGRTAAGASPPVFVLISDANRPGREIDPRVAAAWLAKQGIVLHTIALGAGARGAVEGGPSDLIYQPMNIQLLEEVAAAAGGGFFWARDRASLDAALSVIRATARSPDTPLPEYVAIPLYHWALGAGLLWILLWQVPLLLRGRDSSAGP